jgi:hypothetical protein
MRKRVKITMIILTDDPDFWLDSSIFFEAFESTFDAQAGDTLESTETEDLGEAEEEDE